MRFAHRYHFYQFQFSWYPAAALYSSSCSVCSTQWDILQYRQSGLKLPRQVQDGTYTCALGTSKESCNSSHTRCSRCCFEISQINEVIFLRGVHILRGQGQQHSRACELRWLYSALLVKLRRVGFYTMPCTCFPHSICATYETKQRLCMYENEVM